MSAEFFIITFGCQMNEADSEYMARLLRLRGFKLAACPEEASLIIINTCTVRQLAEDKAASCIGSLKYWRRSNLKRRIIIAGCAAERLGRLALKKRFPFIDEVIGAKNINNFSSLIEKMYPGLPLGKALPENMYRCRFSAYITIMRGCSHNCSYCIVPSVRGGAKCLTYEEIIAAAKERLALGAKELVLLGQTVNAYKTSAYSFTDLLEAILNLPGLARLRFISPHPLYFDKRFIQVLKSYPKLARHLHLPVQSGSNRILKLMRRGYTRQQYLDLLAELRENVPDLAITTDFIVGYPGESESDFDQTLKLAETCSFSGAFCFKYSNRKPTSFKPDIGKAAMQARLQRLLECVKKSGNMILSGRIAKIEEVLFETPSFGRSSLNMAVRIAEAVEPGSIRHVKIIKAEKNTLYGKVL